MSSYISDFRQGNTKTIKLDYGQGIDITGWVFHFILKENIADTENVMKVSITAGDDTRDDIINGLTFLVIPSTTVATVNPGKYYWSLQVDKGGVPAIVETIMPPLEDYKDRVNVVEDMDIS